jgi:hypothetical protein
MAHQRSDGLLFGESIAPGEYLTSLDERFRLYLRDDGNLDAIAYTTDRGVVHYWGTDIHDKGPLGQTIPVQHPENVRLTSEIRLGGPFGPEIVVGLISTEDYLYWTAGSAPDSIAENPFITILGTGNIVVLMNKKGTNEQFVNWNAGKGDWEEHKPAAVPPNVPVAQLPPGTIILDPTNGPPPSNVEIVNRTGGAAAVRNDSQIVTFHPNDSVFVGNVSSSTLSIEVGQYPVSPTAADGTPVTFQSHSLDDLPNVNDGTHKVFELRGDLKMALVKGPSHRFVEDRVARGAHAQAANRR